MHAGLKLLGGVAATLLLARGAGMHRGQAMMAELSGAAAAAMAAHGVVDGSVRWRDDDGHIRRVALLSGSADAATRATVIAEVRRHPGIADARWVKR